MKERLAKRCIAAFFAAVSAFAMCALMATPAFAANTPVSGGTTKFEKHLVMESQANVPNVTFGFTIAAGAAVNGDGNNPAIYAGIGVDDVEVGKATFAPGDATKKGKPGDSVGVVSDGYKYASKQVTVDFGKVSFTAPGIYRYIIAEAKSSADGITDDSTATRTLDVYVAYADESDSRLEVKGYAMYLGTVAGNTGLDSNKSDEYVNAYETSDLVLEKQVTGNQGDRHKYFEFTVEISNAAEGTVYAVALPTSDNDKQNLDTLTVGTGGTASAKYYLKDGQSIKIQGLTSETQYRITETAYTEDGYKTSVVIDSNAPNDSFGTDNQTMGGMDHKVVFTNHKEGAVPTGILLETAPYLGLGVAVLAGLVLLLVSGRRRAGE